MDDTIIKQEERVKFSRTASGKYVYEITLLGKPEDNVKRTKQLKQDFNNLIEFNSTEKEVKN